jgi:hypothetical protein
MFTKKHEFLLALRIPLALGEMAQTSGLMLISIPEDVL